MIIRHASAEPQPSAKRSRFTGQAVGDSVLPTTDGITINTVTFEPGARTHWHQHEKGQLLFVTSGYGLICSEGGSPQRLRMGDMVWIPAGERHWHGAVPTAFLTHVAVSFGTTEWSAEVTQEEYSLAPSADDATA